MKYKVLSLLVLILILFTYSITGYGYNHNYNYNYETIKNYIAYRIKYIHNIAYNTNVSLSKVKAKKYAETIINWSNYYSRELGVRIDPLLVTSILETETNFVSRSDYDNGESIGISSMKVDTARWVAKQIDVDYNKWRMLDATDLGIRLSVYYLGLAHKRYNNNIHKIIVSYNQGFKSAHGKDIDNFYNEYLFKVLGRYDYYHKRINTYGNSANRYFAYKLSQLD